MHNQSCIDWCYHTGRPSMSRSANVTLFFGDGEHKFRLAIGELRELQEACDAGPPRLLSRLKDQDWRVDDVRQTIRIGLIGGGMKPEEASQLTVRYVDEVPDWTVNSLIASVVLSAALVGDAEETVGEGKAASQAPSEMKGSDLPPSMEPVPPSASPQEKSTK